MKLKCTHDKRVIVTPSGRVWHRYNGSECESKSLSIGTEEQTDDFIARFDLDKKQ